MVGCEKMNKKEYRKYRHWLLDSFEGQRKLLDILLKRKEHDSPKCLDCGMCCKHCPAFEHDTLRCKIWKEAKRVFRCDLYPLCPEALEKDNLVGVCRYYWD